MTRHAAIIGIAHIADEGEFHIRLIRNSTFAITNYGIGQNMHKKKPMLKKVLKHLKQDVKDEKKEIKEDVQLGKSIKKAGSCKK